jgi:ElaB/YqjD/DUF883 family membrane-anchored ribosome-binding protein
MPKKIINKRSKVSFRQKCTELIQSIQTLLKSEKKNSEKKVTKKRTKNVKKIKKSGKKVKKMIGGDNFIKDIQRAGKGLGLSMVHTFDSMSNLGKDMYCETDAIMNIGRELDLGYTQDCPFTKTKSWDWNQIKQ